MTALISYAAHPIRVVGETMESLIGTERAAVASVWHGNNTWAAWVVNTVLAQEGQNYSLTGEPSQWVPRADLYKRAAAHGPGRLHGLVHPVRLRRFGSGQGSSVPASPSPVGWTLGDGAAAAGRGAGFV